MKLRKSSVPLSQPHKRDLSLQYGGRQDSLRLRGIDLSVSKDIVAQLQVPISVNAEVSSSR